MVWSIETLEAKTGLNQEDLEKVRLLSTIVGNTIEDASQQQIGDVQSLLIDLVDGKQLAGKLKPIAPESAIDTGISGQTMGIVKDFPYRTRHYRKIADQFDDIYQYFLDVKDGKADLDSKNKVTLEQYGILHDMAYLNGIMEMLNKDGLIAGNERLEKLYNQTQKAKEMITHFDNTFDQKFKMPVGATVFDNVKRKATIYGKALDFFSKIMRFFVTKFGHASKGMTKETDDASHQNKISHINPGYQEEKFNLRNFLYSDVYAINLEALVDDKTKDLLQRAYGDEWVDALNNTFSGIEREIHDNANKMHGHIMAEGGTGRFAQIATVFLQGGHQNLLSKHHSNEDIRDNIMGRGRWQAEGRRQQQKFLCSEFIGMTVIASIQELNDVLKKDLMDKGISEEDIPETLVTSPISEYEKLELLTPERLLKAMKDRGAVKVVDTPKDINKFIKTEGPKSITQKFKKRVSELSHSNEQSPDAPQLKH